MDTNAMTKGLMYGLALGLLSDVIGKYIPGAEV